VTAHAFLFAAEFPDESTTPRSVAIRCVGGTPAADSTNLDDASLVLVIREGDAAEARTAFDAFYDRMYARLIRFATRLVQDSDVAHDAVQDAFIALWMNRTTWHAPGGSEAYLYTAVRNRALKQLRHERVVLRTRNSVLPVLTGVTAPDVATELDEFDVAMSAVLAELPERRRTAFTLRAVDGLGYDAIGAILGVSGPAAYKHVLAATQTLRQRLAKFAG
jgi:RNA polymerase sigma-70 factor (ECF subfamily)